MRLLCFGFVFFLIDYCCCLLLVDTTVWFKLDCCWTTLGCPTMTLNQPKKEQTNASRNGMEWNEDKTLFVILVEKEGNVSTVVGNRNTPILGGRKG